MVFSSPLFLFWFFPITIFFYYLIVLYRGSDNRAGNWWLLMASLVFYFWGAPKSIYLLVFAVSIVADFFLGIYIDRLLQMQARSRAKIVLWFCIVSNLLFLGYYKYANFFVSELVSADGTWLSTWQKVILPVGISFIVFHKISYLVDIYMRKVSARRSLSEFTLYILFFPQLIAGPIVRYHTISNQIDGRQHSVDLMFEGMWRFAIGMGKKVLIANQLGLVADTVFSQPAATLDPLLCWVGIVAYAFQIYFDFSGYTDMAIGLGMMFGFRLPENFKQPYLAKSITEFWRRWHMSLSLFFRDYVFIPLGGNRGGLTRTLINLWVVFLLCGLWHGAQWTFVFWGAYFGFWLTLEKLFLSSLLARLPAFVSVAYTFFVVLIGWVFFRAPDFSYALTYLGKMFDVGFLFSSAPRLYDLEIDFFVYPKAVVCLLLAIFLSFTPERLLEKLVPARIEVMTKSVVALVLFVYSILNLATATYNPFLYFQF